MAEYLVFIYVEIIVGCITIILHTLGILSIYGHSKKTNQNVILSALSVTEIVFGVHNILSAVREKLDVQDGEMLRVFVIFLRYFAHFAIRAIMFLLTGCNRQTCR